MCLIIDDISIGFRFNEPISFYGLLIWVGKLVPFCSYVLIFSFLGVFLLHVAFIFTFWCYLIFMCEFD